MIYKIILIVVFLISLILPVIFFNRNPEMIVSLENKRVTSFPLFFNKNGKINKAFLKEFEDYWTDNLGLRELAISVNVMSKYYFFGKYAVPKYILGKQKHLYYTGENTITTYQGIQELSEEDQKEAVINLKIIETYFTKQNIPLFFTFIPDKERVYPEYYPDSIIQHSKQTYLDKIVSYAQHNSDLQIINLSNALINSKNDDYFLYYKNSDPTHWNMMGAFVGYHEIMGLLKRKFINLRILNENEFNITQAEGIKNLGKYIKFNDLNDINYFYEYDYTSILIEEDIIQDESIVELIKNLRKLHYRNPNNLNSPRLLIFGDSYIHSYIALMISESFSEVYFIIHSNMEMLRLITQAYSPDLVLFQMVERVYDYNLFNQYKCLE